MSLFAGNVSHRATADDVRNFFSRFGPCRVDVKRGYAFIDYDNDRDAEDARNDTNGRDFHGMKLNVEWSKKHIARTGGAPGPSGELERRRSRYADDRRPRDHDWDHNRDYRRRGDYDRYDRERDRDYDRRGRDLDRPYDRDRDDGGRYDRGRDRYNPRDYYGRDDRYDRPRDGRGRTRERSRERGQEHRGYNAENDREDNRNGGDDRPSDTRENDSQMRTGEDREKGSPGEGGDVGKPENNDIRDRDANGNGQNHADSEFDRSRDDDNYRRRPRDQDDPRDGDGERDLGSDRKRMRRADDDDERGRRGRDYDEPNSRDDDHDGSHRISSPPYSSSPRDDKSNDRRGEDDGEYRSRDEDREGRREPTTRSPTAGSPQKADGDDDFSRPTEDIRSAE